jgi:hypothetical protein
MPYISDSGAGERERERERGTGPEEVDISTRVGGPYSVRPSLNTFRYVSSMDFPLLMKNPVTVLVVYFKGSACPA